MEPKSFLRYCLAVIVLFSAAIALFNIVIDPYLIFGSPRAAGFNARKSALPTQAFLMKAYEVVRAHPRTVLLGTSTVEIGLAPDSSAWPTRVQPVYNLALPNSSLFNSYRYLQHVAATDHPNLVILGISFTDVLTSTGTEKAEYETRLQTSLDGGGSATLNYQHAQDLLHSALSTEASIDSFYTFSGNVLGNSTDTVQGGLDESPYWQEVTAVGSVPYMTWADLFFSIRYTVAKVDTNPLQHMRAILNLCRERNIRAILVIEPAHADQLEIFDLAAKWPALEEWKRKITTLVAEYASGTARAELWDFYSYDRYSTEAVSQSNRVLHWFFDPEHYTQELGDVMVRRIFENQDGSFGVRLTPENIEAHLEEVRSARASYRTFQPQDAERIRRIYALAPTERGATPISTGP